METIILYASKYGCTADCAMAVKNKMLGNVTLVDFQNPSQKINMDQYSTVIIGSSIYIGMIPKELKKFCMDHTDVLKNKHVGIFLCCADPEQSEAYYKTNFPEALLKSAKVTTVFGGEARLEKMKFIDKAVVKMATKGNPQGLKVLPEAIDLFVQKMSTV